MKSAFRLAFALLLASSASEAAPPAAGLASHRAVYDVSLDHTSGDVVAAEGRMAIEFRDTCDGWSTTQRLIADMTDSGGIASRTDFFVMAWESKDGRTMRFDLSGRHNGKVDSHERGSAKLGSDDAGRVELVEGKPANFLLPKGTQFPTTQLLAILRAIKNGKSTFKTVIFQGGGKTDIDFSNAIIGRASERAKLAYDRALDKDGLLKDVPAWSVLITFFPLSPHSESPDYEIATNLFANGVNGSMSLIYPTYTLRAKLVRLDMLKPSCGGAVR